MGFKTSTRSVTLVVLLTSLFYVGGLLAKAKEIPTPLVKDELSSLEKKVLEETRTKAQKEEAPDGIFKAPRLKRQIDKILSRFQETKLVDGRAVILLTLGSTPTVNAWVSSEPHPGLKRLSIFKVVLTKGFIDMVSDPEQIKKFLPEEKIPDTLAKAEGLIAAVIAHELGHAMNGDTRNVKATTRVFNEIGADQFSVRLMTEAGYDPALVADMLELLGSLHGNKSISNLVHEFLDEHPRANYRIAAISELIQHSRASSKNQGSYLGYSAIDRAGKEVTSKNSVKAFKLRIQKPSYVDLDLRRKLRFLETYLAKSVGQVDFMTRQTVVAIGEEYGKLLSQTRNLDQANQVIDSIQNFQGTQNLNKISGSDDTENVKAGFQRLNHQATSKIKSLLGVNSKATLEDMIKLSRYFDEKTILGLFGQALSHTSTYEEVLDLLFLKKDNQRRSFHQLFFHFSRTNLTVLYRKAALAMMRIEPNPMKTMEALFQVVQLDSGENLALREVAKGIGLYVFQNNDIQWDGFLDKLQEGKTSELRLFRKAIYESTTAEFFMKRRFQMENKTQNLAGGNTFTYAIGAPFKRSKLDYDSLALIYGLFSENRKSMFNRLLNDIFENAMKEGVSPEESIEEFVRIRSQLSRNMDKLDLQYELTSDFFVELTQKLIDQIPKNRRAYVMKLALQTESYAQIADIKTENVNIVEMFEEMFKKLVDLGRVEDSLREKMIVDVIELKELGDKLFHQEHLADKEFTRYRSLVTKVSLNFSILTKIKGFSPEEFMDPEKLEKLDLYLGNIEVSTQSSIFKKMVNDFITMPKQQVLSAMEKGDYKTGEYHELMQEASEVLKTHIGVEKTEDYKAILNDIKMALHHSQVKDVIEIRYEYYDAHYYSVNRPKGRNIENAVAKSFLYPETKELLREEAKEAGETSTNLSTLNNLVEKAEWASSFHKAIRSENAIEALLGAIGYVETTLNSGVEEESTVRTNFLMFSRALSLVKNSQEMKEFAVYFSFYLQEGKMEDSMLLKAMRGDFSKFSDMTSMRYRTLFFEEYIKALDTHKAWTGESGKYRHKIQEYSIVVVQKFYAHATHVLTGQTYESRWAKILMINMFQKFSNHFLIQRPFMKALRAKVENLSRIYVEKLIELRSQNAGSIDLIEHLRSIRGSVAWSVQLDKKIGRMLLDGELFNRFSKKSTKRDSAIEWLKEIRSPAVRDSVYRKILQKYGYPKIGWRAQLSNYIELYKAYKSAEVIWTKETLEELKNASTDLDRINILNDAWKNHAEENAAKHKVTEMDAMARLQSLAAAYEKTQSPVFGEIGNVFPEGSRFKDSLMEEYASKKPMNFDEIKFMESKKSYNTESPLHKFSKAAFEMLDELIGKLESREQAEVALYLSGVNSYLDPALKKRFKELIYKSKNREKAIKRHGIYANLDDIREIFMQSHPEERLVAFRALFVKGLKGDEARRLLEDKLLFSDPKMPEYLQKVIRIYNNKANDLERAMFLSWIMANSADKQLTGPEIVKLMIEQGGVGAAKLAQLVASHGFRLPRAYQEVLEKFKGKAQKIDKIEAMKFIKARLPEEKYKEIKSLDTMFGAGSLKMAFGASLQDGRKVVIMLAREFIEAKVDRELELMRGAVKDIMADASLRIDSLPSMVEEVERIILEEMQFDNEKEMMKAHKRAVDRRPLLIRRFGNEVKVLVPQPLEGWDGPGIIVEEYVNAKGFSDLPKTRAEAMSLKTTGNPLGGWTQKSLAKASINEIVNQMMVYMFPGEHEEGRIFIDIDPHEENQLAKANKLGFKSGLVNIDLGQTVKANPAHVKDLVNLIASIYLGRKEHSIAFAQKVVDFKSEEQVELFKNLLNKATEHYSDPIEALTEALEELQIKGVGLKQDYIYFQKLFSTMVGLKRHVVSEPVMSKFLWQVSVKLLGKKSSLSKKLEARFRLEKQKRRNNNTYMTHQIQKAIALRGLTNPGEVFKEIKSIYYSEPVSCKKAL